MQAIILAAGMGKRLKELTQNNTKCMVKVNGVSLIDRLLHQLEKQHLSRIVIVVGYEGQKLIDYIATLGIKTPISYVDNAVYDKTKDISLYPSGTSSVLGMHRRATCLAVLHRQI